MVYSDVIKKLSDKFTMKAIAGEGNIINSSEDIDDWLDNPYAEKDQKSARFITEDECRKLAREHKENFTVVDKVNSIAKNLPNAYIEASGTKEGIKTAIDKVKHAGEFFKYKQYHNSDLGSNELTDINIDNSDESSSQSMLNKNISTDNSRSKRTRLRNAAYKVRDRIKSNIKQDINDLGQGVWN